MVKSSKLSEKVVLARSRANDLNGVKTLNCWGAGIADVSILKKIPNVEVINFSANCIGNLEPFSNCHNLKELYLRKNDIKSVHDIACLRNLSNLRLLWLSGNPFCKNLAEDDYRLSVLRVLPNIVKLDNTTVTVEELEKAKDFDANDDTKPAAGDAERARSPDVCSKPSGVNPTSPSSMDSSAPETACNPLPRDSSDISPDTFPPVCQTPEKDPHGDAAKPSTPALAAAEAFKDADEGKSSTAAETPTVSSSSPAASLNASGASNHETNEQGSARDSTTPQDVTAPCSDSTATAPSPLPLTPREVSCPESNEVSALLSGVPAPTPRTPTPPPTDSGSSSHSSTPGVNPSDSAVNMTLEETNLLRVQLGLKPLSVTKYSSSNHSPPKLTMTPRPAKHSPRNNLLTATLALIAELDEDSLLVARDAIADRLQPEQEFWNRDDDIVTSSTAEPEAPPVEIANPKESLRSKIVEMLEPG